MCATSLGKICASDHAMNAVEEMSALNRDLKRFFDENGASYPVWQVAGEGRRKVPALKAGLSAAAGDPERLPGRKTAAMTRVTAAFWYARGDLNPYPCGMEPKSIVSANFTTGAFGGIIP